MATINTATSLITSITPIATTTTTLSAPTITSLTSINELSNESEPNRSCHYCPMKTFKTTPDFIRHLRETHCTKEGGSYVCRYGYNHVCSSLPLDGVNDRDYESHILKFHVNNQHSKEPEQWSIFLSAQNLPAVLNDPSRGKQTNLFTKKWGDSFIEKVQIPVSPYLPEIKHEDFDFYMKRIGKRYRRHKRINLSLEQQDQQQKLQQKNTGQPTLSSSLRAFNELHNSSLRDIPEIFTKDTLELNNPATFSLVFPGIGDSVSVGSGGGDNSDSGHIDQNKEKQTGRLLQEKLSHYLDIVEVQIAKQVSQKSSAFFHAMTSQDAIMEQMNAATKNVKDLRSKIKQLDEIIVKNSLEIINLERSRTNRLILLDKLKLMATVHQTQPMIQLLLGTQDYVAALDLISTTQEIVAQELIGIHCFKYLPSQLLEMERLIDKMLITDFERYSATDLNRPLHLGDYDDRVLEEDKLICIISGLLRQKNFTFIETYKEDAIVTIKALIKQMVIEIIANVDSNNGDEEICLTGGGEAAQIRSISDWITVLTKATDILLRLLNRIQSVCDIMRQIAGISSGCSNNSVNSADITTIELLDGTEIFLTEQDFRKVDGKLKDMLQSVCNYCHERCTNLISNQTLEQSQITGDELEILEKIIDNFIKGCEKICGLQCGPLRVALTVQGTRFSQKFHADRKSKLSLILDTERWKQSDVPYEFQKIINEIENDKFLLVNKTMTTTTSSTTITTPMTNGDVNQTSESDDNNVDNYILKTISSSTSTIPPAKVLIIEKEPYTLVGSALLLIQIICEYCQCAVKLPFISSQLSRHIIDLLRTFNSRCCQLVLGAGALHVAGLKTITSGNLALVSRALQLVLWLLPHIKKHFQNNNNNINNNNNNINGIIVNNNISSASSSSLIGYDAIERDLQIHIKEIENKVLSIVGSLVDSQLANWNARPPVPSQSFRNISRHLIKLHEAISSILPEQQVHNIYRIIHKNFKDKLRELLLKFNIINNGGPQHGVVISELTFYIETLRTHNALTEIELSDNMDDIWLK